MPKCSEVVSYLIALQQIFKIPQIILAHRNCIANMDFWSVCECACVYIRIHTYIYFMCKNNMLKADLNLRYA
jgi:hypothetical protein